MDIKTDTFFYDDDYPQEIRDHYAMLVTRVALYLGGSVLVIADPDERGIAQMSVSYVEGTDRQEFVDRAVKAASQLRGLFPRVTSYRQLGETQQ